MIATVCNLVALTPGNFLAALYDRGQLPPLDRAFVGLVLASLVGALAGALMLLRDARAHIRATSFRC